MAKLLALLLLLLVVVSMVSCEVEYREAKVETALPNSQYYQGGGGQGRVRSHQCPAVCGRRCGRTQYRKHCLFYCKECCQKCLCVPPGYYGNRRYSRVCPCYTNMKTKRGGRKCP